MHEFDEYPPEYAYIPILNGNKEWIDLRVVNPWVYFRLYPEKRIFDNMLAIDVLPTHTNTCNKLVNSRCTLYSGKGCQITPDSPVFQVLCPLYDGNNYFLNGEIIFINPAQEKPKIVYDSHCIISVFPEARTVIPRTILMEKDQAPDLSKWKPFSFNVNARLDGRLTVLQIMLMKV